MDYRRKNILSNQWGRWWVMRDITLLKKTLDQAAFWFLILKIISHNKTFEWRSGLPTSEWGNCVRLQMGQFLAQWDWWKWGIKISSISHSNRPILVGQLRVSNAEILDGAAPRPPSWGQPWWFHKEKRGKYTHKKISFIFPEVLLGNYMYAIIGNPRRSSLW